MRDRRRYSRQVRLAGVGEAGQARIAAASASVGGGLSGWVAARYLAGAGIGALEVATPAVAEAARVMDDAVKVVVEEGAAVAALPAMFESLDPSAREVAAGAHRALLALLGAVRA